MASAVSSKTFGAGFLDVCGVIESGLVLGVLSKST